MISRIFVRLSELPGLKKTLWRALYDFLARIRRTDDWTFMNYGYAAVDGNTVELAPSDEADRSCVQLYHHVASAVKLEGLSVVEVGSGRGGGAAFVKRYLRAENMIGVDLSSNAVALCRKRHPIGGLDLSSTC